MKYKNAKRINSIPEWIRTIVLPAVILLIIPFGITRLIEYIPAQDNTVILKQYALSCYKFFGMDMIIAQSIIINWCFRKVTLRNNWFKLLFLMLGLDIVIKCADYALEMLLYSHIETSVATSIFGSIIALLVFLAILYLTRLAMKHLKCFRPKRLKWVNISSTERNILIIISILAIVLKIAVSVWRHYFWQSYFNNNISGNFLSFIGILSSGTEFENIYYTANIIMCYSMTKLVFCPVRGNHKENV